MLSPASSPLRRSRSSRVPALVFALAVACVPACGDNLPDTVGAEDAAPLFLTLLDEIHGFHVAAMASNGGQMPASFVQPCDGGGDIAMEVEFRERDSDLFHRIEDCALGLYIFDGDFDYLRTSTCSDRPGLSIDIVGELDVDGPLVASCSFDLRERCGTIAGTSCGFSIALD